ncbi:EcsC family protein [uncultured Roseobacter sp.]|uniref:EcsC family protein n=1 Tax=uncultured Roseobacter sp. TaxID=114847 RepID=UPI00263856CE|nr:EcsC family protein [uncultured Roseobacter sp.]
MENITQVAPVELDRELDALAERYARAGSGAIDVLNLVGGRAEGLLDRLPKPARTGLQDATRRALEQAMKLAQTSRGVVPDQSGWLNRAVGTAMGAAGGAGGLPTALAELPVTTTLLLRIIQGVAAEHGFDPTSQSVQFDCIEVFASAGPLEKDDGADLGFLSARVTLTGAALQGIIARVAPRLATVLGQKLAAQTVPVLGAVAGAVTNYTYTNYYQEMAHVHFGLRRLAIDADVPLNDLVARLRQRLVARKPR